MQIIVSLEALGFPPLCAKRQFLSEIPIWLCALASPHVGCMAVGTKSRNRHGDRN